ncbi:DUF1365 domain-containing protein [Thiocystis violacea]|uniref:DUF1365 domain-containing protein n=1 Tax=Thiocystis violacea TaxID=13725 RepID=UPI001904846E|nr:DUF1365 domain-containing protein [Thiocystis violacea]MBK1716908.1 hypothetical protein [Thiocystis violacea]
MTSPAAQLLFGDVMHRRLFPVRYRFAYRIFSLLVDVERVDEVAASCRFFSHNRFNLFSFHERDHGPRDGGPLKPWLLDRLRRLGQDFDIDRVELQSFPRVLGHVFNPLSVWTCFNPEGEPLAVLCEVNNTFGEAHGYLLHEHGAALSWPIRQTHAKEFHVSPFVDMNADYHFRFSRVGGRQGIVIREYQDDALMLVAVQNESVQPMSDANLLRAAFAYPFLTLKVVVMIHWQALRIWLRGGVYYPKPAPPIEEIS